MNPKRLIQYGLSAGIILLILVFTSAFILPWKTINWGTFAWRQTSTVTVIGEAKTREQNKKASFSAGVNVVKDKKEQAIAEVNEKIAAITSAVKNFGINPTDIQTQNLSIYQEEEAYTEAGRKKQRLGQWRVSSSIEIVLRDVGKASALAELLSTTGANSLYGPNFTLDEDSQTGTTLLSESIADARKKGKVLADAAGKKLGAIVTVTEGPVIGVQPMQLEKGGVGGGNDMTPGTQTIQKSVTVTFSLDDASFFETLMKILNKKL